MVSEAAAVTHPVSSTTFFPEKLRNGELPIIQQPCVPFIVIGLQPANADMETRPLLWHSQCNSRRAPLFWERLQPGCSSNPDGEISKARCFQMSYRPGQAVRHSHFSYRGQPWRGLLSGGGGGHRISRDLSFWSCLRFSRLTHLIKDECGTFSIPCCRPLASQPVVTNEAALV